MACPRFILHFILYLSFSFSFYILIILVEDQDGLVLSHPVLSFIIPFLFPCLACHSLHSSEIHLEKIIRNDRKG